MTLDPCMADGSAAGPRHSWIEELRRQDFDFQFSILEQMIAGEVEINCREHAELHQLKEEQKRELQHTAQELNNVSLRPLKVNDPGATLDQFLKVLFRRDSVMVSNIYGCLCMHLEGGTFKENVRLTESEVQTEEAIFEADDVWDNHHVATSFVLMLSASAEKVASAFQFVRSAMPRGLPTLAYIEGIPSDTLSGQFEEAKAKATAKLNEWTVFGVCLIDMAYERLKAVGEADELSSFNHSFVMCVGPEGVSIYQGWRVARPVDGTYDGCFDPYCQHTLGMDRWLQEDKVFHSWERADKFVRKVDQLSTRKPRLDDEASFRKITRWFRDCFQIDIGRVCQPNGNHRPLPSVLDVKLRICSMERIQDDDVCKYRWV